MNILFITASRIGDAVLTTGILDYLYKQYPEADYTIVCGPLCTSLFEGFPAANHIIALEKQSYNRHWINLYKKLKGTKWDMIIDLRDSAVSRILPAKEKFIKTKAIDKDKHKVEQAADVMKRSDVLAPTLWFSKKQYLKSLAIIPEGSKVLGIGPAANWIGKTWPEARFIELVEKLTDKNGIMPRARVAVFAAPGEEETARHVLHSVPEDRRIDVIAKVDPGTAAACLARCDIFVGNDSGLMHCAAAVKTPTVGLFGPSYPHLYRPWGARCAYVSTPESFDELTGFKGYDPKTLDHTLMESLSVDAVSGAVESFWKKQR